MQHFTIFDIIIVSITLLLGLKGVLRGFTKEVFALVGLIGGIFVGSRVSSDIGEQIAPLLGIENQATIQLMGFILGFIGFWAIVYVFGMILSKIFNMSGLGLFDRVFGFIFGSAKVFLIFSIITFGFYQIQSFKKLMDNKISDSITFPFLVETGAFIIKLDTSKFSKMIDEKLPQKKEQNSEIKDKEKVSDEIKNQAQEIKEKALDSTQSVINSVKETVQQKVNDSVEKISNEIKKSE